MRYRRPDAPLRSLLREVFPLACVLAAVALGCHRPSPSPPSELPAASPVPPAPPAAPPPPAVPAAQPPPDHSVVAHLRLAKGKFGTPDDVAACQRLETELEEEITRAQVGEMDGNEVGEGECTLFMFGPDADKLFAAIEPRLRASRLAKGGTVEKRYGSPDDPHAREVRIKL